MYEQAQADIIAKGAELSAKLAEFQERIHSANEEAEKAAILTEALNYLGTEALRAYSYAAVFREQLQDLQAALDAALAQLATSPAITG